MLRPVEVGRDPAHHVVAGGRDGDPLVAGSRPASRSAVDDVREARRVDRGHVEVHGGRAGLHEQLVDRAWRPRRAARARRRSARPAASCSVAPSPRIASVTRKPSRPLTPTTAVGWNWTNSRSASSAPAARASSRPEPYEPGGFVVRDHSAAAPPEARITARAGDRPPVVGGDAVDAAVGVRRAARGRGGPPARRSAPPRRRRPRAGAGSAGRSRCRRRGRRGGCGGRPPARARGRRGGRRRSGRRAPRGRRSARAPRRTAPRRRERRTRPRPATSVSSRCSAGRVVHRERGGEPALRPVGRGLGERAGGDQRHAGALARRRSARRRARRPRRRPRRGRWVAARARRVRYRRAATLVPPRRRARPRHPRPSRAAGADRRARGGDGAPRLVRLGAGRGAAGDARPARARASAPRTSTSIAELSARGGGAIDMDTTRRGRHVRGGAAGRRRRGRAGRRAAARRRAVRRSRRCGRPATTPRPRRAMGFCFFNNVAVAAAHARAAHGAERVLILDWDVHHGNGTNDIFHADPSVLFCSIHESPLYPGTGPASDVGLRAGRGVHGQPAGARAGRATRCTARWSSTSWRRSCAAGEPELVLVSAGFDAHRGRPARVAATLTEAGFAAMTASLRRACADGRRAARARARGRVRVSTRWPASMAAVVPVLGADAVAGRGRAGRAPARARRGRAARRVLARSVRVDAADVGVLGVDAVERVARLGLRCRTRRSRRPSSRASG